MRLIVLLLVVVGIVHGWLGQTRVPSIRYRWMLSSSNAYSNSYNKNNYYSRNQNANGNSNSNYNNNVPPPKQMEPKIVVQQTPSSPSNNNNYNNNYNSNSYNNNNNNYNKYNDNNQNNNMNQNNGYQSNNMRTNANSNFNSKAPTPPQPTPSQPTSNSYNKPMGTTYGTPPAKSNNLGNRNFQPATFPPNDQEQGSMNQLPRSEMPSRFDTCLMVVSGVIGTEPREAYLKNGHYVQSFSMAIVGHFGAVHEGEKYKPTETMWLSCEIWDCKPSPNTPSPIRKGNPIHGVGYLISNKWIDKNSGEEKKSFKFRVSKLIPTDTLYEFVDIIEDKGKIRGAVEIENGSYFSSDFPIEEDQTQQPRQTNPTSSAKVEKTAYTMTEDFDQPLDVWDNFPPRSNTHDDDARNPGSSSFSRYKEPARNSGGAAANNGKSWKKTEVSSTWDSLEDEVEESNKMLFYED